MAGCLSNLATALISAVFTPSSGVDRSCTVDSLGTSDSLSLLKCYRHDVESGVNVIAEYDTTYMSSWFKIHIVPFWHP